MLITELDFDGAAWGELRRFVQMGEHLDDDQPVELATEPHYTDGPTGFRVIHEGGGTDG